MASRKALLLLMAAAWAALAAGCNWFLDTVGHAGEPCTKGDICVDGSECLDGMCVAAGDGDGESEGSDGEDGDADGNSDGDADNDDERAIAGLVIQTWAAAPTGLTGCFDGDNARVNCADVGGGPPAPDCDDGVVDVRADYCGQDAQYAQTRRSFEPEAQSGGRAVYDPATGLMWAVEFLDEESHQDANRYCAELIYAGRDDWYLPNVHELRSLVNYGRTSPNIDTTAFPNAPSGPHWTRTTYTPERGNEAWTVDFAIGYAYPFHDSEKYAVRCCRRDDPGAVTDAARLADMGDFLDRFANEGGDEAVLRDRITDLSWQATMEVGQTWPQALHYCEKLAYADKEDWRLPNLNEATSLLDYGRAYPAVALPVDAQQTMWSSTTVIGSPSAAWYISFGDGEVASADKTETFPVARCVRGGRENVEVPTDLGDR